MMDPDIARMLADLGSARRDQVSAPGEEVRGRVVPEDVRRQQALLAEDEARRAGYREAGPQTGVNVVLQAWNTETNFGSASTGDLVNRYNGQGHRPARQARINQNNQNARWDDIEDRVGEERRRYLQERDANRGNYIAAPAHHLQGRGHTPRAMPMSRQMPASIANTFDTARRNAQEVVQRQRAPSPRAAGTHRFLHGKLVQTSGGNVQAFCGRPVQSPHTTVQAARGNQALGSNQALGGNQAPRVNQAPGGNRAPNGNQPTGGNVLHGNIPMGPRVNPQVSRSGVSHAVQTPRNMMQTPGANVPASNSAMQTFRADRNAAIVNALASDSTTQTAGTDRRASIVGRLATSGLLRRQFAVIGETQLKRTDVATVEPSSSSMLASSGTAQTSSSVHTNGGAQANGGVQITGTLQTNDSVSTAIANSNSTMPTTNGNVQNESSSVGTTPTATQNGVRNGAVAAQPSVRTRASRTGRTASSIPAGELTVNVEHTEGTRRVQDTYVLPIRARVTAQLSIRATDANFGPFELARELENLAAAMRAPPPGTRLADDGIYESDSEAEDWLHL